MFSDLIVVPLLFETRQKWISMKCKQSSFWWWHRKSLISPYTHLFSLLELLLKRHIFVSSSFLCTLLTLLNPTATMTKRIKSIFWIANCCSRSIKRKWKAVLVEPYNRPCCSFFKFWTHDIYNLKFNWLSSFRMSFWMTDSNFQMHQWISNSGDFMRGDAIKCKSLENRIVKLNELCCMIAAAAAERKGGHKRWTSFIFEAWKGTKS